MNLKKGDNIIVLTGKDRGKKGTISKVLIKESKVVIDGLNLAKRHQKARRSGQKGEIITIPMPMHSSNVSLVDPKSGKGTRVGIKFEGGKRVRVAKKSGVQV